MRKLVSGLILVPLILASLFCRAESRQEALIEVRALIDSNHRRIEDIDKSIKKGLMSVRGLKLNEEQNLSPRKFSALEKELESLSLQRREHLMRQDFLDRLSFQVDRHFQGGDLKAFLEIKILEMAQSEISSSRPDTNMWKFLSYLSLALKDLPERHEAPFAFIEGYMRFSTLLNPTRPNDYMAKRSYTNGVKFETAEPMEADRVGEVVEAKLKELQALNQNDSLPFEQRKPHLKPISQMFENSQQKVEVEPAAPAVEFASPLEAPAFILPEPTPVETALPATQTDASGEEMKVRLVPQSER